MRYCAVIGVVRGHAVHRLHSGVGVADRRFHSSRPEREGGREAVSEIGIPRCIRIGSFACLRTGLLACVLLPMVGCAWFFRYSYREVPLAKVIQDVQPFAQRRIELDPKLAAIHFTGIVDALDPEGFVRELPLVLPVDIDDSRSGVLLVRCRARGCPELSR
jgi:hypothetical protein